MTAEVPRGAVVITPTEMYREMQEIGKKVDHLTSVLDPALTELRDDNAENKRAIETLSGEVRRVDGRQKYVAGAAMAFGTVAGYIVKFVLGG